MAVPDPSFTVPERIGFLSIVGLQVVVGDVTVSGCEIWWYVPAESTAVAVYEPAGTFEIEYLPAFEPPPAVVAVYPPGFRVTTTPLILAPPAAAVAMICPETVAVAPRSTGTGVGGSCAPASTYGSEFGSFGAILDGACAVSGSTMLIEPVPLHCHGTAVDDMLQLKPPVPEQPGGEYCGSTTCGKARPL